MSIRAISLAALVTGASVVAVTAHSYGGQSPSAAPVEGSHFTSHMCAARIGSQNTPISGHDAHLAAILGLSGDQQVHIERIAADACAAMAKYHDQILAELTPGQRAKLHPLHGETGAPSALHRLMKKLHGR
jgi:hypothetical protein